jgi:hypothetical protein
MKARARLFVAGSLPLSLCRQDFPAKGRALRGGTDFRGSFMQHRFCRVLCAATALALAVVAPAGAQAPPDLAALKAQHKRPPPRPIDNPALVALGRELFHDPALSASGKTACGGCHFPDQAWSDREMRSRNDSGKLTARRSQTLIGIGHMVAPVGWDGRNKTLEAQAKASIATGSMSMRETETPVKVRRWTRWCAITRPVASHGQAGRRSCGR